MGPVKSRFFQIVSGLVFGAFLIPAWAGSSVTYQINHAHTGSIELQQGFNLPLTELWSRELGASISFPIIAKDKVFVVVDHPSGTAPTTLYALDRTTGATAWSITTGTYAPTAAAYDRGRLFLINSDGLLRAFDPDTGDEHWATELLGQHAFNTAPTARDGIVYVGGAGTGGTLYAVNGADGKILWTQHTEAGLGTPTLSSDGVFVAFPCRAYQFDAATGAFRWKFTGDCIGGGGHTPVFYSDRLYARTVGGPLTSMTVLDALGGTQLERIGRIVASPAFRGGVGYFPGFGELIARSISTGAMRWRFTGAEKFALAPIVVNGKVVVLSTAGQLFVLDGISGTTLQSIPLGMTLPGANSYKSRLSGFGAGENVLLVPAGSKLFAFEGTAP